MSDMSSAFGLQRALDHGIEARNLTDASAIWSWVQELGCDLVALRAEAVDVDAVAQHLRALGIEPSDMELRQGPADRLVATLSTPRGLVEF